MQVQIIHKMGLGLWNMPLYPVPKDTERSGIVDQVLQSVRLLVEEFVDGVILEVADGNWFKS